MKALDIVTYPDPRLRQSTVEVTTFDAAFLAFVEDLVTTMYARQAVGLAAIQVGRPERVFVVDGRVNGGMEPLAFVNPIVTETGGGLCLMEEGCLSFPGVFVDVRRPRWAKVQAQSVHGRTFEYDADGLAGRCLQHEVDHLDGLVLIDMVGAQKQAMIKRKMGL